MTAESSTINRRKFPRKSFRKTISFIAGGSADVVEAVEIGEGGISFKTSHQLKPEQKMIINFFLPDGDFFSVKTTVRNTQNSTQNFIYGVSFDEVSIALKRQIRAYVARTLLN
jgi:c-di-GMP-binding flagellar brake protein YcgR